MVATFADPGLAQAALSLVDKVRAVLPPKERERLDATALHSLSFRVKAEDRERFGHVRRAVDERRKLELAYVDQQGGSSRRTIRPLGLYFWGDAWTAAAWCELRQGFRNFRVDRMEGLVVMDERFELKPPITLEDFVAAMQDEERRR